MRVAKIGRLLKQPFDSHKGLPIAPANKRSVRRFWTDADNSVPNTGSVARDLLATERTFLAWARTGLGFVGAGSAMFAAYHRNQSFEMLTAGSDSPSKPADKPPGTIRMDVMWPSSILIGNGAFLLLFATRRYVRVVKALQSDRFPLDTKGTLAAVFVTAVGTISSLGLILRAEMKESDQNSLQGAPSNESQ